MAFAPNQGIVNFEQLRPQNNTGLPQDRYPQSQPPPQPQTTSFLQPLGVAGAMQGLASAFGTQAAPVVGQGFGLGGGGFGFGTLSGGVPVAGGLPAGPLAAGLGAIAHQGQVGLDILNGGASGSQLASAYAVEPISGQVLAAADVVGNMFGSRNPRERQQGAVNEALRDEYAGVRDESFSEHGLSFESISGERVPFGSREIDGDNPLSAQGVAYLDPISEVLAGGNDSIREDMTASFASGTIAASSNEEELRRNTLALIRDLGLDAGDIRTSLNQLWQDGLVTRHQLEIYALNMSRLTGNSFEQERNALFGR